MGGAGDHVQISERKNGIYKIEIEKSNAIPIFFTSRRDYMLSRWAVIGHRTFI
jgi:hypothetical protein